MAFLDSPWPADKGNKPPQLPFIGYTLHSKYRWNTLSSLVFVCVCVRERAYHRPDPNPITLYPARQQGRQWGRSGRGRE